MFPFLFVSAVTTVGAAETTLPYSKEPSPKLFQDGKLHELTQIECLQGGHRFATGGGAEVKHSRSRLNIQHQHREHRAQIQGIEICRVEEGQILLLFYLSKLDMASKRNHRHQS